VAIARQGVGDAASARPNCPAMAIVALCQTQRTSTTSSLPSPCTRAPTPSATTKSSTARSGRTRPPWMGSFDYLWEADQIEGIMVAGGPAAEPRPDPEGAAGQGKVVG